MLRLVTFAAATLMATAAPPVISKDDQARGVRTLGIGGAIAKAYGNELLASAGLKAGFTTRPSPR